MVPPAFVGTQIGNLRYNLGIALSGEPVPLTYCEMNFAIPCEEIGRVDFVFWLAVSHCWSSRAIACFARIEPDGFLNQLLNYLSLRVGADYMQRGEDVKRRFLL